MAQISPKLFSADLQKQLFPVNVFYTKSMKDVAAGDKTSVDIPIAGLTGAAKTGTPSLPLEAAKREDDVLSYDLVQVYHDPVLVEREEEITLTYGKVQDVAAAMGDTIAVMLANIAATAWGTTNATLRTSATGAGRAVSLVGATGMRKQITKADLLAVRKAFMKQNLPSLDGIIGVVTPDQYDDIMNMVEFVDYEKTGVESKLATGIVGKILGMDIMVRWNDTLGSIGLSYTTAGVKKALDAVVATTDCPAALFFHPRHVRHAEAFPDTIINRKPAGYLGATIIEAVVRFGASKNRKDEKGVVTLVEAVV